MVPSDQTLDLPREVPISLPVHRMLGSLYSLDIVGELGFAAERFYWIKDVPEGGSRGQHAHKKLRQFLFLLVGSAVVELSTPNWNEKYSLSANETGLFVPPGYWRVMSDFSDGAVMCVLASDAFDESDYIRDWSNYELWFRDQ